MRHLFLDTNVVLDFLIRREPFAAPAADLFQLAEEKTVSLYVSSLSFSNLYYILSKTSGTYTARTLLLDVADLVTIVAVDSRNVQDALRSSFPDVEDAIQYHAACAETEPAIDLLVTRDPKGFAGSAIRVASPTEALALVAAQP